MADANCDLLQRMMLFTKAPFCMESDVFSHELAYNSYSTLICLQNVLSVYVLFLGCYVSLVHTQ